MAPKEQAKEEKGKYAVWQNSSHWIIEALQRTLRQAWGPGQDFIWQGPMQTSQAVCRIMSKLILHSWTYSQGQPQAQTSLPWGHLALSGLFKDQDSPTR